MLYTFRGMCSGTRITSLKLGGGVSIETALFQRNDHVVSVGCKSRHNPVPFWMWWATKILVKQPFARPGSIWQNTSNIKILRK